MSVLARRTVLRFPIGLSAAALFLCAALIPSSVRSQQEHDLVVHTVSMAFDMPNMTPGTFRVTAQSAFSHDLAANVIANEPGELTVCSVAPEKSGVITRSGENYEDFTVTPKAPGYCTIRVSDSKHGNVDVKVTVNLHGVYVTDGNAIKVFAAGISGNANPTPIATIAGPKTGLNGPLGMAIDKTGKIYVANAGNSSVTVYAANITGNHPPIATIGGANSGLKSPWGVALDAAGNIYVTNANGGENQQGSVTIFQPNPKGALDEVPFATIAGTKTMLSGPRGIALDAGGRIYVVNQTGQSIDPPYTFGSVTVYGPVAGAAPMGMRNEAPVATITGANTKLMSPTSIALDTSGKIYVTNTVMGSEHVGHIEVYAANPVLIVNQAPIATITGPNTALGLPQGIAIDASGAIFVANPNIATLPGFTPSVTRYTVGAIPNASPLMQLVGSNVESPSGVAIH